MVQAAGRVGAIARELGLHGLKIAAVTGDDVLSRLSGSDARLGETGRTIAELGDTLVSANAYIGANISRGLVRLGS